MQTDIFERLQIPTRRRWARDFLAHWTTNSGAALASVEKELKAICYAYDSPMLFQSTEFCVSFDFKGEANYGAAVAKELTKRNVSIEEPPNLLEDCAIVVRTFIEVLLKSESMVTQRLVVETGAGNLIRIKVTVRFYG